ncbi:alpha/beta hydrolase family protein [Pseudactinotalea sp. Z1748]|uniref:alpha/beta hydrolase family protein n=1 Tax=Pseudactinotalea sp. Z1748 TaxID=3413027 RepID=UPI003C7ACB73
MRRWLAVLGLVLILGTIGSLAGPRWHPELIQDQVESQTRETIIGSDVRTDPVGTYATASEDFEVDLGGVSVPARLTYPVDAGPDRPGILMMHGAGTGRATSFADQARELASAGLYVLVPAKRMDTYTVRNRNYVQMAADYMVSFDVLADWPGVDSGRTGIYGESEGAYIATVAGAAYDQVDFVVLVSAPVVQPRQQAAFAADVYLRNTGAPGALLRAIPRAVGMNIPGGGFEYADFDASPYQQRLDVPVLMVYGTDDASMPVVQGAVVMRDDLAVAGNDEFTVRYYDGANHGIRSNGDLAPGFTRDLARWTQGLPQTASAVPQVAGAEPEQRYAAAPVASPRWYADGDWVMYTLLGSLGLLVLGPALWAGARIAQRAREPIMPASLARYAAATALAALAALVMFVAYLTQVAQYALNYLRNDLVVVGGYFLVLGTGVLAAGVLYASLERTHRARAVGVWRGPGRLVWWLVHLGAVSLLIIAAYWGVFPSFV